MGIIAAGCIVCAWTLHLWWLLGYAPLHMAHPLTYLGIAVQTYLYTGLFITAHDAMHGSVSRNRFVNTSIGFLCALLYAGMWYPKLYINHHLHHKHPAEDKHDPDFHASGRFIPWFAAFMWHYTTVYQLIIMAVAFNLLALYTSESRLIWFWVLPALLSSLQLFTVGTFLPHKHPHTMQRPHNARSMRKNHTLAMLSCYFFGYHTEHHISPGTPWYRLWKLKTD